MWSPEQRENRGPDAPGDASEEGDSWGVKKARINGTVAHTTAVFGFSPAGLVVADVERKASCAGFVV